MSSIMNTITNLNNNTNQVNFTQNQKNLGSTQLNDGAFMQLLMAQLQYQDPLNPVDNSQFLTQQAQLTQVDKMSQLVSAFQNSGAVTQASTLIGKQVDVTDSNGKVSTGVIQNVSISSGTVSFSLNNQNYTSSQITKIYGSS